MKRRYFQQKGRYFWISISLGLVPFLLFRVAIFYDVAFPLGTKSYSWGSNATQLDLGLPTRREGSIVRRHEAAWKKDTDYLQNIQDNGGREFQGFKHNGEHQEDDRQHIRINEPSVSSGPQEMDSTAKMAKMGGDANEFPADVEADLENRLTVEKVHDVKESESASNELERKMEEERKLEDEQERKLKEVEERKRKGEEERKLREEEERKLKEEKERRRGKEGERKRGEREARKREEEHHRGKDEAELEKREEFFDAEGKDQVERRKTEDQGKSSKNAEEESISQARKDGDIKSTEQQSGQGSDANRTSEVTTATDVKTWEGGKKGDGTNVKEEETTGRKSFNEESKPAEVVLTREEKLIQLSYKRPGDCNLYDGVWEYEEEAGPLYTNDTCPYIQAHQNCLLNGRPDRKYLHYRWKPRDCDLPRFDAETFMQTFKGKTVGFVGDSLARNQLQSLLCMLTQLEKPGVLYDIDYSIKYRFEEHQVSLLGVWAPFLVKQSDEPLEGYDLPSVLHMDVLDRPWTSRIQEIDVMVVSVGQWFFRPLLYVEKEGKEIVGCYQCAHLNVTDIGFLGMVGEVVRLSLEKIASEMKGIAILHTFGVQHYEHGGWESGWCRREDPIEAEEASGFGWMNVEMRDVVLDEFTRVFDARSQGDRGLYFDFIDITKVNLLRADGHPGPYRQPYPYAHRDPSVWVQNDCLHWCMPGPVDTWNQILVKIAKRYM